MSKIPEVQKTSPEVVGILSKIGYESYRFWCRRAWALQLARKLKNPDPNRFRKHVLGSSDSKNQERTGGDFGVPHRLRSKIGC
ncbi:MAG: hypothetical protein DWH99_07645 [Planctomycetota bacterium]|nr:MAG: hypothetical protein DWH99_07645 [Planctomycetota bacterium]